MRFHILWLAAAVVTAIAPAAAGQPASLRGAGWDALRAGDHAEASRAFTQALTARPSDALLHLGLGVAAHSLGDDGAARRALTRALEIEPRLTPATALLGEIVYASGDVAGAITVYERGLDGPRADASLRARLEQWRAEAALHGGFEEKAAGRFNLLFEGPEERRLADRVHRVLEAAYARIGGKLNAFPDEAIQVVLYTEQQFRDVTRSPSWAGGLYDGRIRLSVAGALDTPAALDRVVVHELAHAFVHHVAPRGVPAWLHEGLAVQFEGGGEGWVDRELRSAGRLPPLSALDDGFEALSDEQARLAYAQSAAAARVVTNRLGPNLATLLQALDGTHTLDAVLAPYGFTTADIESAVRGRARGR